MKELKFWICSFVVAILVVVVYHLIMTLYQVNDTTSTQILFFGIPGGPAPPKQRDLDQEKKMTGVAYIYDARTKTYKALTNENGEKMMLDDINFSDDGVLSLINQYRARCAQPALSKDELIAIAKNLGYKTTNNAQRMDQNRQRQLNNDFLNQSPEFKNLFLNSMTTEDLYG